MSSRSHTDLAVLMLLGSAALAGCDQSQDQAANAPPAQDPAQAVAVSTLVPGGTASPGPPSAGQAFEGDLHQIAEGKRLFGWYNCSGCHFNGAGGIGPALMDSAWIYGDGIDQIFASIYQGRPNGMPVWRGKIPDGQIWQIAAYVKSLPASPAAARDMPSSPTPGVPPGAASGPTPERIVKATP